MLGAKTRPQPTDHHELRAEISATYAEVSTFYRLGEWTERGKALTKDEAIALKARIDDLRARCKAAGVDPDLLMSPRMGDIESLWAEENFGELTEAQVAWVKDNCEKWAKGGHVRYYVPLEAALKVADCVDQEKRGMAVAILGLSKNKSFKEMSAWGAYFDALAGEWQPGTSLPDLYEAFTAAIKEVR